MSKPLSTLPNPVESNANFASALAQIGTEVDHQPLRSSALARIMRKTFHGSDAGGAWDWRMAYDLMQAAAVQVLLRGADPPVRTLTPFMSATSTMGSVVNST